MAEVFSSVIPKMLDDVHTERLLVTVFRFLHMSFFPLCIHHENNSDVREYYVESSTNQRFLYASCKTYRVKWQYIQPFTVQHIQC